MHYGLHGEDVRESLLDGDARLDALAAAGLLNPSGSLEDSMELSLSRSMTPAGSLLAASSPIAMAANARAHALAFLAPNDELVDKPSTSPTSSGARGKSKSQSRASSYRQHSAVASSLMLKHLQLSNAHGGEVARINQYTSPSSSVGAAHVNVLPYDPDADDGSGAANGAIAGPAPYSGPVEHLVAPYQDVEFAASWPVGRDAYRVYKRRWWVLFVFCLLALGQSMVWISFSPITKMTMAYYNCSETQVDLLLSWGTVWYLAAAPFAAKWGNTPQGLRRMMLAAAWLIAAATVLRLVPEVIDKERMHPHALWFLHVAQILNAAACPPISVTVTKLSNVWFGERERTPVTALAVVMNNAGSAIGFFIGPYMVTRAGDLPNLLYLHAAFGVATLVAALAYLPAVPPTHPSPAAADMYRRPPPPFLPALRQAVKQPHFMLLALCVGASAGTLNVFLGILSTILPDNRFSSRRVGWYSCAATVSNILGGLVTAILAQTDKWRARLKRIIVALSFAALVCAFWFALSLPSVLYHGPDEHTGPDPDDGGSDESLSFVSHAGLIPSTPLTLGLSLTLLGWCVGAAYPLAFELSVEMTFPLSESVSAGVISTFQNVVGIVFLLVAPAMSGAAMNATLVLVLLGAAVLMPCVREEYARQKHEARARAVAERLKQRQMEEEERAARKGSYSPPSPSLAQSPSMFEPSITPGGTMQTLMKLMKSPSAAATTPAIGH